MTRSDELYACIYVREFPAQATLHLRPDLKHTACVVMEGEPPFEEVCSLNTKARLLGITHGMRRTDVDGFSETMTITRSHKSESNTREIMLDCAATYSPRIEESSGATYFLCVIDIAGTTHLFGPPERLASRLLQQLRSLGVSASVTVSNNFHAAVCLAKGLVRRSVAVIRAGEEAAALSCLPLYVLPMSQQQTDLFALWGITTVGMLAGLPQKELIARIGQDGRYLQQLARGELPHLFQPLQPPCMLLERNEFDFPIESLDSLMFGIAILLDRLITRATARLVSLAAVTFILELEGGTTHTRRVRPAQPGNDRKFWIRLMHLDLQTCPPQAAVLAIGLHADPGQTSKIQIGLFSPPLPEAARLDIILSRLNGLLGEDNVGRPVLHDSHAPESYRTEPFAIPPTTSVASIAPRLRSPARNLRPPETISLYFSDHRPTHFLYRERRFIIEHAYGPWIAGSEWWNENIWNIEQWDVIAKQSNGSILYCTLARDFLRNEWTVITLYD